LLSATNYKRAAELLDADPGLLEVEAWRLFEFEGNSDISLANFEKYTGDNWGDVFRELASSDPAMRARLLDASLAALARDFGQFRAGWFSRFHESLHPTDDERAARADAYLGLLRSLVSPTVSFAVAALAAVERAGSLPPDALLDRIGPVLMDGPAGTAKAGLGLVGRVGVRSAEAARRAAIVASDAFAHPSPEVQRAALALIGGLVKEPDDAVAAAVAGRMTDVAASQRPAAAALLVRLGGDAPATGPAHQRPAATTSPSTAPRKASPIDPDRAIEPLPSFDALIDVGVSVLETGEPADDVERVLEAVGRLPADRSESFRRLTAALAKRARTILARRESLPFTGFDPRADIAAVLLAWATRDVEEPADVRGSETQGAGLFVSARAHEIAKVAADGRPFASMALPTHRGGWIDPAVLVRRLAGGQPASALDLAAAILRLALDGRAAALDAASGIAGEAGAAVRYALGGNETIGPTAAWWVAAARVRAPGHDDLAVERHHPDLGPDAGRASRVKLRLDRKTGYDDYALEIEPPFGTGTSIELPTVLMLRTTSTFAWTDRSDPTMLRWMATIQPGDREPWAAMGSLAMAENVDWWTASWANRAWLEPFVDPVTSIGPHGRTLIAIALGAKEAGERGLAADVATLGLSDGRLTPSTLAEGLIAAAAVSCDRPMRWALSLADVATGSDRHGVAVAEAIARTLPAVVDRPPAKLVALLRLLDELLAGTSGTPSDEAREPLGRLAAAGGQSGRLARSILSRG
jgi:hypothetical protein